VGRDRSQSLEFFVCPQSEVILSLDAPTPYSLLPTCCVLCSYCLFVRPFFRNVSRCPWLWLLSSPVSSGSRRTYSPPPRASALCTTSSTSCCGANMSNPAPWIQQRAARGRCMLSAAFDKAGPVPPFFFARFFSAQQPALSALSSLFRRAPWRLLLLCIYGERLREAC
jgi:hypothetical protein